MYRFMNSLLVLVLCTMSGCVGDSDSASCILGGSALNHNRGEVFVGWKIDRSKYHFEVFGEKHLPPAVQSDARLLSEFINEHGPGTGFIVSPNGKSIVINGRNGPPVSKIFSSWRDLSSSSTVMGESYSFLSNGFVLVRQPEGFVAFEVSTGRSFPWRSWLDIDVTNDHWMVRRKSENVLEVLSDAFSDSPVLQFSIEASLKAENDPFWTEDGQRLLVPLSSGQTRAIDRSGKPVATISGTALGSVASSGLAVGQSDKVSFFVWDSARSDFVRTGRTGFDAFHLASPSGACVLMSQREWYGATQFRIAATGVETAMWSVPVEDRPWRTNGFWLVFE